MTVDNFERIKNFITTNGCDEGEFYLLQIIHRSKDGLTKFDSQDSEKSHFSNKTIKSYYISSPEYLDKKKNEIMEFCHIFNARAYFNPTIHSYKQIALKSLSELAKMVSNEEYRGVLSMIDSSCGQMGSCKSGHSFWIVDIDTKENDTVEFIKSIIEQCEPLDVEKVVDTIPTLHGYHLITKPFNKKKFHDLCPIPMDIHSNNPKLLYYKEVEK